MGTVPTRKKNFILTRPQSTVFHGLLLFLLAVALTTAWLSAGPVLGVRASQHAETWQIDWVQPAGLAWDNGIRTGDVLLGVNGEVPSPSIDFDSVNELTVWSVEKQTMIYSKRIETPSFNFVVTFGLLFIGLVFLAVGLLVYLRASSRQAAEAFFWLCLVASIALIIAPATAKGSGLALGIEFASSRYVANLFVIFFMVFPTKQVKVLANLPHFGFLALAPATLITICYVGLVMFSPESYEWFGVLGHSFLAFGLFTGLALLLRSYLKSESSVTREQIRVIVFGTFITALPLAVLSMLPKALTGDYLVRPELAVLSVIALPLTFAYAIMRHQLMGVRRLIHRGMVYFLFSMLLVSVYVAFLGTGRALFGERFSGQIDTIISIAVVLAIGFFHPQVESAVRKLVDRLLYKDTYDYKETLYELNSKLATTGDEKDLGYKVLSSINRTMNLKFAALFAQVGDRALAIDGEYGLPSDKTLATITDAIHARLQDPTAAEAVIVENDLPILLIPLISGDQCRGCFALGPKRTEEPFREEDIFLLRTFAGHVATYIEKLQLIEELRTQLDELEESRMLLSRQQEEVLEWNRRLLLAQEEERSNIAQYLHDEPLQKVLFLVREVREAVEESRRIRAQALAREVASDLRDFSSRLHPSMIDDLGLVPTLEWLVSEARQRHGSGVTIETKGIAEDERFEPEVELTIYRVAQEAINNSLKHSEAKRIHLALSRTNGSLNLKVSDDGVGFNTNTTLSSIRRGHLGMVGMQERLRQVGGVFKVISAPGEGTMIEADVESKRIVQREG